MDSRAKQRITGAVILVAVFVLVVPELLTGPNEKKAAAEDSAASTDEAGLRSYTIDIDAPPTPAQAAPNPEAAVELPTPAAPTASTATPMAVPGEAATTEADTPAPTAETRGSDAARPPAQAAATPESVAPRPVAAVPATPMAAAPAPVTPMATAETPAIKPAPTASGGFAVQLGSFSSRDNANRLVRDMTAKGFAAFVAPITSNGRELYRVRVGPARDRAGAEALATQLRRIGQTGSIVSIS